MMSKDEAQVRRQIKALEKEFSKCLVDEAAAIRAQLGILWRELMNVRKADAVKTEA